MKFKIETIPHKSQRYETVGDYQLQPDGYWYISVSDTGDKKMNFLIQLHEFIELNLTQFNNISEQSIMEFDLYYEKKRSLGLVKQDSEPGFYGPYKKQHTIATSIEMLMAAELGIDWIEYEEKINKM